MVDKTLQNLRRYIMSIANVRDAFTGIHLSEAVSKKLPCLVVKQTNYDQGIAGHAKAEFNIEIHVNSLNLNDDLKLGLIVSSILEGSSFDISDRLFATLKWTNSQLKNLDNKRIITQTYSALIMEKSHDG